MAQAYFVRQPVYNHRHQVIAYRLAFLGRDLVDIRELLERLQEIGLPSLVGNRFAMLRVSDALLSLPEALPFPSSKAILYLDLPAAAPDAALLGRLQQLAEQGYQLVADLELAEAMDDEALQTLSLVAVDLARLPLDGLRERLYAFPSKGIKVLALNVESHRHYDLCVQAGCRFFHGGFFMRPEVVQGRRLPAGRLTVLRLLAQLQSPDTDLKELEEIISQDVALSYRLLRHLNSAYFGLLRKVESIRHAVVYLGLKNLRVWASVILMTKIEGKPSELMKTALVRGKMCELLAEWKELDELDTYFTVGLLSTLDVLLDCPMEEVLKELPVSLEIQRALLHHEGVAGAMLRCVLDYESADWAAVQDSFLPAEQVFEAYLNALHWGEETLGQLTAE